jgi:hypothetical protein
MVGLGRWTNRGGGSGRVSGKAARCDADRGWWDAVVRSAVASSGERRTRLRRNTTEVGENIDGPWPT